MPNPPKLKNVIRLDSLPLGQTQFTEEGYLKDRPILTSVGIFEYRNEDGSPRYELRLPEEVFDAESLASYKGKPIMITHDAGLVTKDNVHKVQIGTILSEGYKNGDDVRAEIIIHDTKAMKESGLKELSLGYNLDLEETPGEWNGHHYDAIQRNIRINHLALVQAARAGEQARLNIDSRDSSTIKGGKAMSKKTTKKATQRADGVLTPEELQKAIEEYKAKRNGGASATDSDPVNAGTEEKVVSTNPGVATGDADDVTETNPVGGDENATVEEKVEELKDRRDRRDEEGEPEDIKGATEIIANQDADINALFDIIDTLLAEREFNAEKTDCNTVNDEDDTVEPDAADGADEKCDEDDDPIPSQNKATINEDSIDKIVRQRVKIGIVGKALNMDGLESMNMRSAKIAVVRAVRPNVRLDGKSDAYIDAMFDLASDEVNRSTRKDTAYQLKQMFNADSAKSASNSDDSSLSARDRMIARNQKNHGKKED